MAQPATTPKIEELRYRIKTDPKSRLFFPLAEELRKVGQSGEAEQVLRTGLAHHPTYLSAWVSLGRVLRDLKNDAAAIEPLSKALTLDPGNVVAARLLADAYLATGEKLEAIKKYKLVHALMPGDDELNGVIARLARELDPPAPAALSEPGDSEPEASAEGVAAEAQPPLAAPDAADQPESHASEAPSASADESPFAASSEEQREEVATGDVEPMLAGHDQSPFEEPAPAYSSAAMEIEAPEGMHIARAPLSADVATELPAGDLPLVDAPPIEPATAPADLADVFAPADDEPFASTAQPAGEPAEDFTNTITMADLYARQGLVADARMIYENILQRDPQNDSVQEKLAALNAPVAESPAPFETGAEEESPAASSTTAAAADVPAAVAATGRSASVQRLEAWLAKVGRREVDGV